jgi:hypothetical protein
MDVIRGALHEAPTSDATALITASRSLTGSAMRTAPAATEPHAQRDGEPRASSRNNTGHRSGPEQPGDAQYVVPAVGAQPNARHLTRSGGRADQRVKQKDQADSDATRLAMADLRFAAWFLWMTPLLTALSS